MTETVERSRSASPETRYVVEVDYDGRVELHEGLDAEDLIAEVYLALERLLRGGEVRGLRVAAGH